MARLRFESYDVANRAECLQIFDANCPEFFAANEREDYLQFLSSAPTGYEICWLQGRCAGAFGLSTSGDGRASLNWIMISPDAQGEGIGTAIMQRMMATARDASVAVVDIAASHKSAAFFARFGAESVTVEKNGWGAGMHRVDMELWL